jgi:hypothetical protein
MSHITNTTTDPTSPLLVLASALGSRDGGSSAIEAMEKRGQTQLVNSDRLPSNGSNGERASNDDAYLALGFTFGQPDLGDPMFRPATLPPGWRREASDHAMWSYIVDELDRRRVAIFYKAAYYDRSAFMRLETTYSYCANALYENRPPTLDDTWLTAEIAVAEFSGMRDEQLSRAAEYDRLATDKTRTDATYWQEQAAEHRQRAGAAQALIDQLTH